MKTKLSVDTPELRQQLQDIQLRQKLVIDPIQVFVEQVSGQ